MAIETDQQIDDIASPIALLRHRECPESLDQPVQALLHPAVVPHLNQQLVEYGLYQQLSLGTANIVFGLALQQGIAQH